MDKIFPAGAEVVNKDVSSVIRDAAATSVAVRIQILYFQIFESTRLILLFHRFYPVAWKWFLDYREVALCSLQGYCCPWDPWSLYNIYLIPNTFLWRWSWSSYSHYSHSNWLRVPGWNQQPNLLLLLKVGFELASTHSCGDKGSSALQIISSYTNFFLPVLLIHKEKQWQKHKYL